MVWTSGRTPVSTLKSSAFSFSWGEPVIDPTTPRSPPTRNPADTGSGSLPAPSSTSRPRGASPPTSDDTAAGSPMVAMTALAPPMPLSLSAASSRSVSM